ncbi:hypothetical protein [Streptomyces malaysiensis]|uniref:Uncharacterized protein n=1 Tax=Streptomyces malaysiensis subsp. samsunensis TaxID=459658 RepID=A0A9X2M4F9_STRMQ|nr:hypothetical protein [Streptomyces samsunensis]MCQ8835471.1 hypothetical protein [Streptomyces samsunensis]
MPTIFLSDADRRLMDFAYLEAGMRAQEAGYDAMTSTPSRTDL